MDPAVRALRHAALGDERRLAIVDELAMGDLTVSELAGVVTMEGNLLAHHLEVLTAAGLIERRVSEGDRRRRYVSLVWTALPHPPRAGGLGDDVVFVCTRNSARSQFAAALWRATTGGAASSAGTAPAPSVHPHAIEVAGEYGVDLSAASPAGYDSLPEKVDLVISVCDRARESGLPAASERKHWSIPDPVVIGTIDAFRTAFDEIAARVGRLTA